MIHIVQINEDGTFHQLDIDTNIDRSKEVEGEDDQSYFPVGVELTNHETGTIDLTTGEQLGTKTDTEGGVTWSVRDDQLFWERDMGEMGGQGVDFRRLE